MRDPVCLTVGVLVPVVLLGLMLWIVWMSGKAADLIVGRKHRTLEEVLRTREAPAAWRERHRKRIQHAADAVRARELQKSAQADYLRRLDELVGYVRATALVADEETRETLLDDLTAIRAQWEAQDLGEF